MVLDNTMSNNLKLVGAKIFGERFLNEVKTYDSTAPFDNFFDNVIAHNSDLADNQAKVQEEISEYLTAYRDYNECINKPHYQFSTRRTLHNNMNEEMADVIIAMSSGLTLVSGNDISVFDNFFEIISSTLTNISVVSVVASLYTKIKTMNDAYDTYINIYESPMHQKPPMYQTVLAFHDVVEIENIDNAFKIMKTIRNYNKMIKLNDAM